MLEPTACDGSTATIVSDRLCVVPMSTIRTLTLLPRDSLIRVKVRAYNARGIGQFSEMNTLGATVETEPTNLMLVSIDVPSTSNTQTKVVWTPLTGSARGGKDVAVTKYEVFWDQSTGDWVSLTQTTDLFALKTGLTGGVTYRFKVRAYNKYGEGPFTEEVSVQTSQAPETPVAPTVEIVGGYVKISWAAPFDNYRPILGYGYQVLIATSTGAFVETKSLCDGLTQEAVRYCLVDMHDLRASPYNLIYGDLIQAKVLARNERGWSAASPANTDGAHVEVEPSAVVAPARGILTGPTQLDVYWTALNLYDAGGSQVLSYHLQYDNATAAVTWLDVVGLAPDSMLLTVIVSSQVVSGDMYGFRVRARNIFGWGPYSQVTYIQAAREPAKPLAPVTSIDAATGGVVITWTAPSARGQAITAYKIEFANKAQTAWSEVATCDGSAPATRDALRCVVAMSTFTEATFGYLFDDVVYVRVKAYNSYGYGELSEPCDDTGARIRVVPS